MPSTVPRTGPLDDWDQGIADFDEIIGNNTRDPFLLGRAVAPIMISGGGGHIVNVATDHVFPPPGSDIQGHGRMDLCNASKWAINGLTLDWSISFREQNIQVNQLCMGATKTEMTLEYKGDQPEEVTREWMQPNQIADVLVQLLQEGPAGRTGHSIGMWVGRPVSIDDAITVGRCLDD